MRNEEQELSPYRGLAAFGDSDLEARLFFGRDRETEIVAANLQASRLTILYGASGVGKSSLLRAGVVHRLRANGGARQVVAVCSSWRGDPIATVAGGVAQAMRGALGDDVAPSRERSLADELEHWSTRLDGEIYVVLDQLEEYVLYHGADRGGPLADALAEIVTRPSMRVGILIGIRDDALAELDALKAKVPGLFANLLRLDHLTRAEGREAIVGPLRELASLGAVGVTAEDELVEAVLDQVAAGRIVLGEGAAVVPDDAVDGRIEAPFLQLVMERVWDVERARGSATLRNATLTELGGAGRIVEEHLETALTSLGDDGRGVAASVFGFLVTPSGTKIAHRADDLARYAGVDADRVGPVLDALVGARILRRVADGTAAPRYEIFHDVLAPAVLDAAGQFERDRLIATERRRRRRAVGVAAVALAAVGLMAAVTVYALDQRAEAKQQAAQAEDAAAQAEDESNRATRSELSRSQLATSVNQLEEQIAAEKLRLARLRRASKAQEASLGRKDEVILARTRYARANELVATSASFLTVDPELSLLLASEAATLAPASPVVEDALRLALRLSNVRAVLPARGPARAVAYSDSLLVVGSEDGTARIYPAQGGKVVRTLDHGAPVNVVAFNPRGTLVATGGEDGFVRLWSVANGTRLAHVRHPGAVTSVGFSEDGMVLLTAGSDRVRLSRTSSGARVADYRHPASVEGAAWASHAPRIVVWGGRQVAVRDGGLGPVATLDHEHRVHAAAISPDGRLVATGTAGELDNASVWDVSTRTITHALEGHQLDVFDVAFSPDGSKIATGSGDGTARVWETASGELVRVLSGHRNYVTHVAFSPDGGWLATASRDGTARVRSTGDAGDGWLFAGHRGRVGGVVFSQDGRLVATAADDGTARVWDAATAIQLQPGRAVVPSPRTVARTADGRTEAKAVGKDIVVTDRRTHRTRLFRGHLARVTSVAFSPDGSRLVSGSNDHDARVWNVATGETVHLLAAQFASVADARFSPDGRWIVTAGPRTVGLWQAESGAFVDYVKRADDLIVAIAFDRASRTISEREKTGRVRSWRCDICGGVVELQALAKARLALTGRGFTPVERKRYLG